MENREQNLPSKKIVSKASTSALPLPTIVDCHRVYCRYCDALMVLRFSAVLRLLMYERRKA